MIQTQHLLTRLEEIGRSLERSGQALALIGLGSVGLERERLDEFSDLDFFAVVESGCKVRYLENLDWLSSLNPLAYAFKNTADGYKLLFSDGVFCEFAVFEPAELAQAAYAPGRMIWRREDVPASWAAPQRPAPAMHELDVAWQVGEALTNLYVGLGRFRRGEKLSAQRFIQHYAVDRLLALNGELETPQAGLLDPFSHERRCERRYPLFAQALPQFVQGYERSPQSALAILAFLEAHFSVNPAIAARIRALAVGDE